MGPPGREPAPVGYARRLVKLQGRIWLIVSVGLGLLGWLFVAQVPDRQVAAATSLAWASGCWAAAIGCLCSGVGEIRLSRRLQRAARWNWTLAFAAECVMAALGWFLLYPLIDFGFVDPSGGFIAGFAILPVPVGGLLSLLAAAELLLPQSRRYLAAG
jgi:hypothetical protein